VSAQAKRFEVSFKRTHDNLARDVAKVVTELDAARPIFRKI
jgi:hypothetical protein